jgi:hypothetical protein
MQMRIDRMEPFLGAPIALKAQKFIRRARTTPIKEGQYGL